MKPFLLILFLTGVIRLELSQATQLRKPANMSYPFTKVEWEPGLNMKLLCNEDFSLLKECAEQCYYKENLKDGCIGFVTQKGLSGCTICRPAKFSEISSSSDTELSTGDIIYLKKRTIHPDIYLPLEPENATGTTVAGEGENGVLVNEANTGFESGKQGEGLSVQSGGRLDLSGTGNKCYSHVDACADDSITVMLWVKPRSGNGPKLVNQNANGINIKMNSNKTISVWVIWGSHNMKSGASNSIAELNVWTHITGTFSPLSGASVYINGILENTGGLIDISNIVPDAPGSDLLIGGKATVNKLDGVLDEIKFFYRQLSNSGNINFFLKYF